ncbi:alkaline phosphatase family protein [Desulfovibrio inopinatus]|uniref:alkaline phosphatase family protein n=1 Tax=Desulfovibrio inopinatus TaxID=102109 RepID=UPI000481E040|nr:alkaline phosphatase family protein [Desulfovibrio inopinatus]
MSSIRKRCVVLGLDGVALTMAKNLAATGKCPNLGRIAEKAVAMDAELPELSPVNWTSFATAAGPAEHGVYGFTAIHPGSYAMSITDSTAVACQTIFDRLGHAGLVSKVINLPHAYPAHKINGVMVAGFVAPDLSRAIYPPPLFGPLRDIGYKIEADTTRGADAPEYLFDQLRATLAGRRAALRMFWPDLDFDLFVFVLTETDRLFHFFHPAITNPNHLLHTDCLDLLAEWDLLVGEVLDRYDALPEPKRLIVMADHGFADLKVEVDLNAWLASVGLLKLTGEPGEWNSERIGHPTAAFALDPGRIYMHIKERYARGVFHEHVGLEHAAAIRDALLEMEYEGKPIFEAIHLKTELYFGPLAKYAPQIVCVPNPGFCLTGKFDRTEVFGHFNRHGVHTAHDALYYDSTGYAAPRVRDAGRAVLDFFDIPRNNQPHANRL